MSSPAATCTGRPALRLGRDLVRTRSWVWQRGGEGLLPTCMTLGPWGTGAGAQATRTRETADHPLGSPCNSKGAFTCPGAECHRRGGLCPPEPLPAILSVATGLATPTPLSAPALRAFAGHSHGPRNSGSRPLASA